MTKCEIFCTQYCNFASHPI